MKVISKIKKGQEGEKTPTINQVKSTVRPFMTDDFHYRFSKYHPEVQKQQLEEKYDTAPIYEAPYNQFSVDDQTLRVPFGTAAFYTKKASQELSNRMNTYLKKMQIRGETDKDHMNYASFARNAINPNRGTITFDSSSPYDNSTYDTMSHEVRHMYDAEVEGLTGEEESILRDAYPHLNLHGGNWKEEASATNTELRNTISRRNNGALKEDLDRAIDNTSDQDLYDMYIKQNGYTNDNDYYKRNTYQEFLDYQQTPEYKSQYIPYTQYMSKEQALQRDLQAYDQAVSNRYGLIALKAAKEKTKNAKKIFKDRKKQGYQAPQFPQTVIDMYNKFGNPPRGADLNQKELDPNKMQLMRKALKDVAYVQPTEGSLFAKLGTKLPRRIFIL